MLVDASLSGLVLGQTLSTRAEQGYRALLEATAFGSRMIVETFGVSGVPVREFVVAGGLLRNRPLMQLYADVLRMPISTIGSEQGPALGSAIHAAVAAGAYEDVRAASEAMGRVTRAVYRPDPRAAEVYDRLYAEYRLLHDHFGRGGNDVDEATQAAAPRGERMTEFGDTFAEGQYAGAIATARAESARCMRNSRVTASSSGPPGTSAPGCPAPTCS